MTNRLFLLSTAASLTLASLVAAQETATEDAETPNADISVLDTGETVPEQGAGQVKEDTYLRATHGDWSILCLRNENGPEPCQMYQLLRDQNGGSVAEVSLFKLTGAGGVEAGGTFTVPLETLLTEKLNVSVDSGQTKRYDYSFCTTIGCFARVGFTSEDIAAFRRGSVANVTIIPALAPDQRVTVGMSLTGFTAAFEELAELETAQQ